MSCEFPWACGPPMEMKAAFPRPIDSKWVKARLSTEFPWACGPPMEMKAAFPRPIDSKWVKARLSTEFPWACGPPMGGECNGGFFHNYKSINMLAVQCFPPPG